jgi:hypothetical protein
LCVGMFWNPKSESYERKKKKKTPFGLRFVTLQPTLCFADGDVSQGAVQEEGRAIRQSASLPAPARTRLSRRGESASRGEENCFKLDCIGCVTAKSRVTLCGSSVPPVLTGVRSQSGKRWESIKDYRGIPEGESDRRLCETVKRAKTYLSKDIMQACNLLFWDRDRVGRLCLSVCWLVGWPHCQWQRFA